MAKRKRIKPASPPVVASLDRCFTVINKERKARVPKNKKPIRKSGNNESGNNGELVPTRRILKNPPPTETVDPEEIIKRGNESWRKRLIGAFRGHGSPVGF